MKISDELLRKIESDLGLNVPYIKGQDKIVKHCWHFSTDGNKVDEIFIDDEDFRAGMNRIYLVYGEYNVVILAFSLMDTHVHFILYGEFDECNRFMHEYIRQTSQYISSKYGNKNKMHGVGINHQFIDTDFYLRVAICYTIKNAPAGGLSFNAYDYPWSSGTLVFRRFGYWNSPSWHKKMQNSSMLGAKEKKELLKTHKEIPDVDIVDGMIFPGEYVANEIVERIFKTPKGFNYYMCISRESDVESRGGSISHLTIPMQEMRQHKNELCRDMFNVGSIKTLNTQERIRLARALKAEYNSSLKQIARLCGLVYDEVKHMI